VRGCLSMPGASGDGAAGAGAGTSGTDAGTSGADAGAAAAGSSGAPARPPKKLSNSKRLKEVMEAQRYLQVPAETAAEIKEYYGLT
jgi:hypothetical protein